MIHTVLIVCLGITAAAVSFVFIRESSEPPVMLAAWRVLLAALLLLPLYLRARAQYGDGSFKDILQRSWLPGITLAAHFIFWVIGARLTIGANATLLVNMMPLVMPCLMASLYGEQLHRREWWATALALCGLLLLGMGDVQIDRNHLLGDLACFVSMLLFALYLALARRQATLPSVWLYLVPLYAIAGLTAVLLAPLFGPVMPTFEAWNLLNVFALAAVSTVIGHSALNYGMQRLRGQTVTLLNLFQFVIAALVGWWVYQEVPGLLFYPAGMLVVAGVVLVVFHQGSSSPSARQKCSVQRDSQGD